MRRDDRGGKLHLPIDDHEAHKTDKGASHYGWIGGLGLESCPGASARIEDAGQECPLRPRLAGLHFTSEAIFFGFSSTNSSTGLPCESMFLGAWRRSREKPLFFGSNPPQITVRACF